MELNWDNARKWQENANKIKNIHNEPKWKWDSSFKLDFDGALLSINSRFYPPLNKNDQWEGNLNVVFLNKIILTKKFKENTLEKLRISVEKYLKNYTNNVEKIIPYEEN
jgi:hypothetical protein